MLTAELFSWSATSVKGAGYRVVFLECYSSTVKDAGYRVGFLVCYIYFKDAGYKVGCFATSTADERFTIQLGPLYHNRQKSILYKTPTRMLYRE